MDFMFLWTMRDAKYKNKQENCTEGLPHGKLVHTLLRKLNISPMVNTPLVGVTLEKFAMKSLKQMHYTLNCNTNKWEKTGHGRFKERQPDEGTSGGNVDLEMVMNGIKNLRVHIDQQNSFLYSYLEDMRTRLGLEPYHLPYPFPPPSPPHL